MINLPEKSQPDAQSLDIARRWCDAKGRGWSVLDQAGRGGTAPVYSLSSPDGDRALKIYDSEFSSGAKGEVEKKRVDLQVSIGQHACPSLVQVYEGGTFEDRFFVLMSRAPGQRRARCDAVSERPYRVWRFRRSDARATKASGAA